MEHRDIAAVRKNLDRYYAEEVCTGEKMSAALDEAVRATVNLLKERKIKATGDEFTAALAESMLGIPKIGDDIFADAVCENSALLSAKAAVCEGAYIGEYCRRLAKEICVLPRFKKGVLLFVGDGAYSADNTVAVLGGELFFSALECFSRKKAAFTEVKVRSFADACEAVYSGECAYCILPIENSRDGALGTFIGMIEKNDLIITALCNVTAEDGITTSFALLCRNAGAIIDTGAEKTVAIRMVWRSPVESAGVFAMAAAVGATTVKCISRPLDYTYGYAQICTYSGSREALFALLAALGIMKIDYTVIGIYESR